MLLNDLKNSAPSRVVIVTSSLHDPARKGTGLPTQFRWTRDEINDERNYNAMQCYKNTNLANIWFCYELAKRLRNSQVTVNCLTPGFIPTTGLSRYSSKCTKLFMHYVLPWFPICKSEESGGKKFLQNY